MYMMISNLWTKPIGTALMYVFLQNLSIAKKDKSVLTDLF